MDFWMLGLMGNARAPSVSFIQQPNYPFIRLKSAREPKRPSPSIGLPHALISRWVRSASAVVRCAPVAHVGRHPVSRWKQLNGNHNNDHRHFGVGDLMSSLNSSLLVESGSAALEHFQKSCSDVLIGPIESGLFGLWLRFGSVTGFFKPAPSPKPRQKPKILAAHRYIFSVNAPSNATAVWFKAEF